MDGFLGTSTDKVPVGRQANEVFSPFIGAKLGRQSIMPLSTGRKGIDAGEHGSFTSRHSRTSWRVGSW